MQEMKMSIVDESSWDQAWEKYSSIAYKKEDLAIEQEEQCKIIRVNLRG